MATAAARLSLGCTGAVALLVLLLHAAKPEFEPSWRFVSEYAIGRNGWLMVLAFLVWALGAAALFAALRGALRSRGGRVGRYLLLVVAAALLFAGLFPADPVTAKPGEITPHGKIHALASMIGLPGIPLAALLIGYGLAKRDSAAVRRRAQLLGLAHLTWISLAVMLAYIAVAVPKAGGFTPEVWAGWSNRAVVAVFLLWQGTLAYRLARSGAA